MSHTMSSERIKAKDLPYQEDFFQIQSLDLYTTVYSLSHTMSSERIKAKDLPYQEA